MDIINTTTKIKIIETLLQNKKSLGISSIANHAKISVSEIWRQISVLIDYGLIIEENRGPMGRYKKYKININNPLVNIVKELFDQYEKIRKFIHLKPLDACSQFLKKYYITGAYAIKEASWDIFYSDGMMVAVDPKEYEKAKLLKNCYINRWNFILLKKPIEKCDYFYDEDERVFKATFEQAIADSIGSYQLDPNNIEILYFLLVENLDWIKLRELLELQWGDIALKRLYYLFSIARILGGQLYPADIFRPKTYTKGEDPVYTQDAKKSCFRILLCNGIAQEQAW